MEKKCLITNCRSDCGTDGKKVLFLEYQKTD